MRKNDIFLLDIPLALVLLTRLPLPRLPQAAFTRQAAAVWAFPVAGLVVTTIACLVAMACLALGLSAPIVAGILLTVQVLLTGAMHEDGLADCADGFWGGFTPDRRLEIMKDSQIGTYGVLALLISLGLRWQAIAVVLDLGAMWSLLALAMLSRAAMPFVMLWLPNARQSGLSQSVGRPSAPTVWVGLVLAFGLSLPVLGTASLLLSLIMALAALAWAVVAKVKIGGQTGDVLGGCQQICELAGLLALLPLLPLLA
ncbi:Cobalamin synthase [Phaeobacter sp. CECT 5382]|uniref:adenosylcobinamide-GDP ribazoletransferase n=1 Tax=Phaeobacter sp. CECT 5382 TaxID=1712645 RepID=UPI0006DB390B|nr:adenosylcobinamide-GDP ribazoletransferase [Phaeobacter sp. CECT 5382]CUH87917.1 Cobalamin synthase [Phaeobacter sp. CECT 5382]